jgi:hypothetical protein
MIQDNDHNWSDSYPHLSKLINDHDLKIGVELGVAAGRHSEYILRNTKIEKLWSIDRWQHVVGYDDPMNLPQKDHDELYEYVCKKLSFFGERCTVLRSDTTTASNLFQDQTLDFVYVDADHSYEGCKRDLLAWIPKIKFGGFITGHDLNWPTVYRAISEALPLFDMNQVVSIGEACWAQRIPSRNSK